MCGVSMEAKAGNDPEKAFRAIADFHPLLGRDVWPRGVGDDREQDVLPVQDLVVFDVFDEGVRRAFGIAGEEDGGAVAAVQFVMFVERARHADGGDEIVQRHAGRERFPEQRAAIFPSHHAGENRGAEDEREPAAVNDFQGIRGEEDAFQRAEEQAGRPGAHLGSNSTAAEPRSRRWSVAIIVRVTAMP